MGKGALSLPSPRAVFAFLFTEHAERLFSSLGAWNRLEDLQKLNWLPIIKRRDLALLKITQKALYDDVWPDYLRLKFPTVSAYNLRSLEAPKLAVPN